MIRCAELSDKAILEALQLRASIALEEYREALLAHPDAITLPEHQIDNGHVLVCAEGGEVTGFAAIEVGEDKVAELDGLFVEPAHWREGIGTRLVEAALRLAAGIGCEALTVVANPTAEPFYARRGFSVIGVSETRFGPALVMSSLI